MSVPAHIGPFQIEAEIGRGGHGVVYRARDSRLDRLVAIKAIAAAVSADSPRMARFREEARIIAQLNHPHIAQIHQVLDDGGRTYLVLEYIPGRSLAELCRGQSLTPEQALRLMAQVARALESAHGRGIVHRDLKPDNIRVTDDDAAKVLDFGIACAAPKEIDTGAPTLIASAGASEQPMLGTPGYMSPEQCRGEPVDVRADIFSFGCVLYECLTGRPAVRGGTTADRIAATLTGEPDFSSLPPGMPDGVGSLLRSCLAHRPDDRLGSIRDARIVLEEALGRHTPLPEAPGRAETPTNLPRRLDHFIGRTREVAQLLQVLDERSLTTLTGSGGCGKTRLALEVARRVMDRFEGGVWLVELAPIGEPALVPSAVAAAMGVQEQAGASLLDAICARIGDGRHLLILDNCEHLRDAAGAFVTALLDRCPLARVLVTSREALGASGELAWRVPSLGVPGRQSAARHTPAPSGAAETTPSTWSTARTPTGGWDLDELMACESVALFVDRAREVRPGFILHESCAGAVASICRRLDGIPLAIELAAARIGMLTPEQIEQHLDDRFRLLRTSKGKPERHQTLRAAIDWSYRMLTEDARRALRMLSVFTDGCALEGACAVIGGPGADMFETLDLLTVLADKSLLVSEESGADVRYRLLETVRQYALEKLAESGERSAAMDRRLEFYLDLTARARGGLIGPEQGAWLARLESDGDDLLDVIEEAARSRPADAQRICADIWRFWWIRGRIRAGLLACARACEAGDEPTPARADALYAAGAMSWTIGELQSAWDLQQQALAAHRHLGDDRGIASALNSLGLIAKDRGDAETAERMFRESLQLKRDRGDDRGIAMSLNNLGIIARLQQNLQEARALYEESVQILRRLGDRRAVGMSLTNVGEVAMMGNDLAGARRRFEEARALFAELDDRQGVAIACGNLGVVAQIEGDLAAAAALFAQAISIYCDIGDKRGLAESLEQAAGLAAAAGNFAPAGRLYGAATALRARIGSPRDAAHQDLELRLTPARQAEGDIWRTSEREGAALNDEQAAGAALAWLAARSQQ
ncbi:MAG: protein kinase [Phycisphaerales bacterium JB039]